MKYEEKCSPATSIVKDEPVFLCSSCVFKTVFRTTGKEALAYVMKIIFYYYL